MVGVTGAIATAVVVSFKPVAAHVAPASVLLNKPRSAPAKMVVGIDGSLFTTYTGPISSEAWAETEANRRRHAPANAAGDASLPRMTAALSHRIARLHID